MKAMRVRQQGLVVMVVLAFAVMLGACGTDDPTGNTTQTVAGVSTAGTPTVSMGACMSCHSAETADWQATRHGNMNSRPSYTTNEYCTGCHNKNGDATQFTPSRMVIGCESCHGPGSLHVEGGGTGLIMNTAYSAGVISGGVSTLAVSGQLLTCMGCHQLLDLNDPASTTTPTTLPQHFDDATEFITDTHFGTPNAWNAAGNTSTARYPITGYALDYASESSCTECHNPHGINNINQEWAASAHAARTNVNKDPQGYFSDAWSHYNWSESSRRTCQRCHTASGFKAYADALGSGNSGLATQIREGQLSTIVTFTTGWKPEMLKCSGCHSDFKGTLRDPGPITAVYSYTASTNNITYTLSNASFAYPDVSKSNVCVSCHVGMESGDTIKGLSLTTAPTVTSMDNIGFINSHYLTAGGTVFTATGYEFDERSYVNPNSYQHNQIGVSDFRSTGTSGPCVGCHMSRPNGNGDHLFLPVSRFDRVRYNAGAVDVTAGSAVVTGLTTTWTTAGVDTAADLFLGPDNRSYLIASVDSDTQITLTSPYTGATATGQLYIVSKEGARITGVASEVCFSCHAGATSALVDQLNEEREMFEASLAALERFLDTRGICFVEAYPYFHKRRTNAGTVDVTQGSTIVTGATTSWLTAAIGAADLIRTADGHAYGIQSVDSDTQITLKSPYLGPTVAGASYVIMMTGAANAVKDWDVTNRGVTYGKNFMGAAFNFNLLEHDPGAYVHNRTYVKRLIYDSIDWLDDTRMNNSAGTSLSALSGTIYPWKAGAVTYLLPNGVLNGIPAERP